MPRPCTAMLRACLLLAAATASAAGTDLGPPDRGDIARRMLHGYQYSRAVAAAAAHGDTLSGPALDPAGARWELIAPDDCSPQAPCGVLVWIHPWDDARAPRDWLPVLRRARVVYVSPFGAGNAQPVLDRRVPLALLGLARARAEVAIDPARTWIGGFSGGGRVASRMAIAWPDVFRGGVFVATSDGPGTVDAPLPGGALLEALRGGRWWFGVGDRDPENLSISRDALKHFRRVCALDTTWSVRTGWGHRTLDGRRLAEALRFLDRDAGVPGPERDACVTDADAAAASALAAVRARLATGDRDGARRLLLEAHRDWGGLVADGFAGLLPMVETPADR